MVGRRKDPLSAEEPAGEHGVVRVVAVVEHDAPEVIFDRAPSRLLLGESPRPSPRGPARVADSVSPTASPSSTLASRPVITARLARS